MNTSNRNDKRPDKAGAELDALLSRGIQADRRATKPPFPPVTATGQMVSAAVTPVPAVPLPHLQRLTVRFTQDEARLLEKVRAAARAMGYKLSDTAVFRLALSTLDADRISAQQIEQVLRADTRRK